MARPANQAVSSGSIPPKKPQKKAAPKVTANRPGKAAGAKGRYAWNGGPATHSISQDQHSANQLGATAGLAPGTLSANLTDPLSTSSAFGLAQLQARGQYQPQIDANQSLQRSVPVWFQNYQTANQGLRAGLQAQSAPAVANAQAGVTNAGALTPGLDPNSPQAATDALAAKGRQALAQLGADALNNTVSASDAFLGGMAGVAARELPQVQQQLVQQGGQLKGQYGAAVGTNFNTLRAGEQNYGLAQATLGANVANQQADNAVAAANSNTEATRVRNESNLAKAKQKAAAETPNQYGVKPSQWNTWSTSHRQRVIDASKTASRNASGQAKTDAANVKKTDAIKKASGGVQNQVQNALQDWQNYVGKQTDDTSKPKDPKTGLYPPRPLNPGDIKSLLRAKGYDAGLIHVMLLVRANKPLDQAAIDYLHNKDPNIRIPRKWLGGSSGSVANPSNTLSRPGAS